MHKFTYNRDVGGIIGLHRYIKKAWVFSENGKLLYSLEWTVMSSKPYSVNTKTNKNNFCFTTSFTSSYWNAVDCLV